MRAEMAESLPASHYLTTFSVDGLARNLKPASSLEVAVEQGRLAVHLTLPVEEPVDPRAHEVTLATYDETYYVAFDLARDQPARLTGEVPTGCRTVIEPPRGARDQVMLSDKLAFNLDLARSFEETGHEGRGVIGGDDHRFAVAGEHWNRSAARRNDQPRSTTRTARRRR